MCLPTKHTVHIKKDLNYNRCRLISSIIKAEKELMDFIMHHHKNKKP